MDHFDHYLRGPEGADVGVCSGGSSGVVAGPGVGMSGGSSVVGGAKMSVVPRNSPTSSMPSGVDTPSRKPVRLCQVCGDIAKSLHFGGLSCDSCKAFFRRSVQNDAYKHFRCGGDQKCAISIASRKFCKYCRFAKCEAIGMTKSWVMSEDERLQLMKTRLTKRMMYQQGGSPTGAGGGGGSSGCGSRVSGGVSGGYKEGPVSYHPSNVSKTQPPRYQQCSPSPTYHPPTRPVDLGSSGSSPNSSPPTPVSGPLTPIQYGPIPPQVIQQVNTKEESPDRSLSRGIKRESDDEEMRVERVFNPASNYLNESEVDILTRVISNIKLVDQQLPYNPLSKTNTSDVMATYKRFAERQTLFLRQFPEFNTLPPMIQGMAIKKNFTVIALVFASSFINEETGSYHNVHSPAQPMITNMNMIQKAMSPEVFNKFREILGSLRQYNVDSRMAYLLVLIIVFNCDGQDAIRENFQRIIQHYVYWKYGEACGKPLIEGLMKALQAIRRHSELFESMAVQGRSMMAANMMQQQQQQLMNMMNQNRHDSLTDLDVKQKVDSLTGEQIRQMLNGMDIEQMKQMLQGNGLEQMKQMLQSMDSDSSDMVQGSNSPLVHSPPLHCNSPQSMVQSPHSVLQSPHSMLQSPHSMMQSPQSMMQSPHSMMDSPHSIIQSTSLGMMQTSSSMSQAGHTMLDISHSLGHGPNVSVSQIIKSTTNLLNNYQDMKPPVSFMNSPHPPLELSQSPIELSSPSSHTMNLASSPAPYIPNQESYIVEHHPETTYPEHCQSPIGEVGYLNPPAYPQAPYSPVPLSEQYNNTYQPLFSPLPYKEEVQSGSNGSTASSSGVGLSLTSSLTSPLSSLLTSPTPSHSSLQESENSLSNYQEPEHGNSLGAAP